MQKLDVRNKLFHYCENCAQPTGMVHSGRSVEENEDGEVTSEAVIMSLHDAYGSVLWQSQNHVENDDIRAVCVYCGTDIPGDEFCSIAYKQGGGRRNYILTSPEGSQVEFTDNEMFNLSRVLEDSADVDGVRFYEKKINVIRNK